MARIKPLATARHLPLAKRAVMRRNQAGMTTLGLIILVSFLGLFAFGFIRLTPVYLNYFKVVGVVDGARSEFDGQSPTAGSIRTYVSRRFDIESVSQITARDIKVTPVDGGFEVSAQYSHKAPFIANISFVVDFDKRAMIRR
ncbi:MAG: DUF4845 domain-containing protein [Woeseiaceae bacterium]|jgi:hypothetical protein|nr:DUF4845 domain-containing protein [Woeseiaceae bacterium]